MPTRVPFDIHSNFKSKLNSMDLNQKSEDKHGFQKTSSGQNFLIYFEEISEQITGRRRISDERNEI